MRTDLREWVQSFTETDREILERLSETGAATATDLAVRLRVMPEEIEPKLQEFSAKELVEVTPFGGKYEKAIYRISDRGRRVLKLFHFA